VEYCESCWDSVALVMKIRIVEFYKDKMATSRNLNILDPYFDQLLLELWPRLKFVLAQNTASLQELNMEKLQNTHPHFVTRRYAELAASLTVLQAPVVAKDKPDELLAECLRSLRSQFVAELQVLSRTLSTPVEGRVSLINNYDLILTIFYERQLNKTACGYFEDLLRAEVGEFIEAQFRQYYPDMIAFVQANETKANSNTEQPASSSSSAVDVSQINSKENVERITKHFAGSWKSNMQALQSFIMTSFVNFNNGIEILKQCLTQLLLYYTRYQKCLHKLGLLKAVQDQIVPNSSILQEIKNYSRGF